MIKSGHCRRFQRWLIICLAVAVGASACYVPAPSPQTASVSPVSPDVSTSPEDLAAWSATEPAPDNSGEIVKVTVQSQAPRSTVRVTVVQSTPGPILGPTVSETAELSPTVQADAEPIIFTEIGIDQRCGHGDISASDGHSLYATPRLLIDDSNFLELLPADTRVDIIDCVLWTDELDVSWLAVRTPENKLGWMIVQPDKFYVTLYPIPLEVHRAVTGVPAGTTVAYVPSAGGAAGQVTDTATATSIGLDFIPVVGDAKGLYEAATGYDMVTGEPLGNWRWLGLLGLIGLSELTLLRHGDEVADGARLAGNLDSGLRQGDEIAAGARAVDGPDSLVRQGDEALTAGSRRADEIADLARAAAKADDAADAAADVARGATKGGAFSDETLQTLAKFEQPCSFSGDTPVATQLGPIPIRDITPGMMVLSHDEEYGITGYFTVTAAFVHVDPVVVTLSLGSEKIETTPEHPFYVSGRWIPAGQLRVGDSVLSSSGVADAIQEIEIARHSQFMYNLTVAHSHTYYVGSGEWLVHNACSRVLRQNLLASDGTAKKFDAEDVNWQAHHVIPGQWEDHPLVAEAIEKGGWKIDDASNGMALPYLDEIAEELGMPAHRGYHRAYSNSVESELDALNIRRLQENWDPQRTVSELEKLIQRLRGKILSVPGGQRLN